MLHTVGQCDRRIFGLAPEERLRRQLGRTPALVVASACAVLDDPAVLWLIENPGVILAADDGRPLAVAVGEERRTEAEAAIGTGAAGFETATPDRLGARFIRKLRRKANLLAFSLEDFPAEKGERLLFAGVYKGVTDLVTKYVWPAPALVVTRAAAGLGVHPNLVTAVGILFMLAASSLFYLGSIAAGLACAWLMTFLDTVDGKLARVTVTSSPVGNALDHYTDIVHPPLWWACLAHGLALLAPDAVEIVWTSCWVILGTYLVGRLTEYGFHRFFGFNGFLLSRFDSLFRLVVARRNVLLLIMTVALLLGRPVDGFIACALWSIASTALQVLRFGQALAASRRGRLTPWMS